MEIHNDAPIDRDYALRTFPNIDIEGFELTSQLDPFYNCFAWAAGDTSMCWEPPTTKYVFWHTNNTSWTIENFIDNYTYIGFTEISGTAELEPDYDKIAIYVKDNGEPSHAARQLENGKWTSKLGIREDIEHSTPECIENDLFGKVKVILKRAKRAKRAKKEMNTPKNRESSEFENFRTLAKNLVKVPKKEIDEQLKLERENKSKNKKRK